MKVGTKSLLFGVHQFIWHPITVAMSWRDLYGAWPTWRECVCIFVHDWGYWGCANMDGADGRWHPVRGAKIAAKLFGPELSALVMLHSRTMAREIGRQPSKLCWPDKACIAHEWRWFYLLRAGLSGEIHEYRRNADSSHFVRSCETDRVWFDALVADSVGMAQRNAAGFRRAMA